MFRRAEQNAAAARAASRFIPKFIGIVAAESIFSAKILLLHPYGRQSRGVYGEAALADHGCIRSSERPVSGSVKILPAFIADIQAGRLFQFEGFRVYVGVLRQDSLFMAGNQNRREETFCIIMQRLPAAEIIDARPADDRPAVIQLPDHGSHAAAAVSPPVLDSVLHGLGLQELGGIDKAVQRGGIQVSLREIGGDPSVGGSISLMLLHHIGKYIPVFREGERFNRLHAGEGLEAEFRHIAELVVPVVRKRFQAVPDIPVMHVAAGGILRFVQASSARRAGRPVEGHRILHLKHLRHYVLIHLDVIRYLTL